MLLLHSGSTSVAAFADAEAFGSLRRLEPGSAVVASGIVTDDVVPSDDLPRVIDRRLPGQLRLLLRSVADLRLVRAPSW